MKFTNPFSIKFRTKLILLPDGAELAVSVVVVGSNRHCRCDTVLQSQKIIINLKSKDIDINANESKAMIRKKKEIFNIHFLQFYGKMLPSRSPS